jgi:hypothetical protein
MRKSSERGGPPKTSGSRAERLAAELKANLKKRKERARARASGDSELGDCADPATGKDEA